MIFLVAFLERPEGHLEGGQPVADNFGLPRVGAAGSAFGVQCRTDCLQRSERVLDPGTVAVVRDRLTQRIERLYEVIGAPLDVSPPGRCVTVGELTGAFRGAHALLSANSPGPSAALIASCRAEPFAYASISLDRQSAVAAERRRAERTIHTIRPARTAAPSRTHSQTRLVPEPELMTAAVGEVVAAGVVTGVDGVPVAVTVAVAVDVAVTVLVTPGLAVLVTPQVPAV